MRAYLAPLGVLLIYGLCSAAKEVNGKHDERSVGHRRDVPQRATKYRIATILSKPYVMHDASQKLVGFIPDLVEEISILLDFDYEFILYTSYGRDLGNTYDGMIGGLNAKEVSIACSEKVRQNSLHVQNGNESAPDFAAADLTVTSSRRAVVDFVHPFDDIGLTIIIQKPYYDAKTDAFSILDFDPFTFTVLSPLTVEVALALWAINKFNPYEWQGRYDVGIASKEEAEAFNLPSSLWFAFTTLQWQGFEKAPRSWSGKILSIFWFIFVTIVIVTYTAGIVNNLFFASLVHERDPLFNRIHSLAELVQHPHGYSYGVIKEAKAMSNIFSPNGVFGHQEKYRRRKRALCMSLVHPAASLNHLRLCCLITRKLV
ncbi:hypothetical protein CAPTEDRAFT_205717 [Capitella teleta]|uniref:Ionotropic glutamate receptor C-terminal domain-containing protein n=1 Tax=Capitella teleta TaxID=283909 RepID=R7TTP8_CAPTE|nr:hypothetical protein CAPTEDRAFT_205717 [Capitella teleta]|eukprot:ELT97059.1 hypothetical protein CAPTEDRAFT_205717 [Capitella teleta]